MDVKKYYRWFVIFYWGIWISLFTAIGLAVKDLTELSVVAVFIYLISFFGYLITMGKLVARVNKSVITWVGLTMITKFLGVLVSYFKMKTIAIEQGWD